MADITANNAHERAASLLAAIVESSDDAIISKDLNGIVTSWNKGAERIFGYTAGEMIGQSVSNLAPPERRDEMPSILQRIVRGERIDHYETVRMAKDGRRIDISLTVSPIHDDGGQVIGASKIGRDISERKIAEDALALNADRLIRANADLQQFAYITSHDLQEPLRTVLACTEMFLSKSGGRINTDEREWLTLSTDAARRMTGMINDLLTYSQTLNEDVPMEWVKSSDVIDWAIGNLHVSIASSGAAVIYERALLPVLLCNKIQLVQLFQNLVSNAIRYRSDEPPRIDITAHEESGCCIFAVRDNGIGIAPAYHDRIFILFQRLYNREYPGTGIGLALCRKIVQTHGGKIWVESDVGKGATFKFSLPTGERH